MAGQGRSRIELGNKQVASKKLPAVNSDVLICIGVFPWGPMHEAQLCLGGDDFIRKYGTAAAGPFMANYEAGIQVKNFFDMGGRRAVVIRVSHLTNYLTGRTLSTAAKGAVTLKTSNGATYGIQDTLKLTALYEGARALYAKVQNASNGEADRFDLLIYETGVPTYLEWHRNLTMDSTDVRYVEDVLNTSSEHSWLVTAEDLTASGTPTERRPVNIASAPLTGGNEGLTALDDNDFIGSSTYRTGIYGMNTVTEGDMLICPDRITTTTQNALALYCDQTKSGKILFYVEAPALSNSAAAVAHAQALTAYESRSAVYWPQIKMANPLKSVFGVGDNIEVSPVGMICGRVALNSRLEEQEQFTQPGNDTYGLLNLATGLEGTAIRHEVLDPNIQDYVTDYGINPIVSGTRSADGNFGVWASDVQLGKTTGNWTTVGWMHGLTRLRRQVELYLEPHRTQGMTEKRRRIIKGAIDGELLQWLPKNVFASTTAEEAFYVNTDPEGESINNPLVQQNEEMVVVIGLANAQAGRFIKVFFTKDDRAIQSYIQKQLAGSV